MLVSGRVYGAVDQFCLRLAFEGDGGETGPPVPPPPRATDTTTPRADSLLARALPPRGVAPTMRFTDAGSAFGLGLRITTRPARALTGADHPSVAAISSFSWEEAREAEDRCVEVRCVELGSGSARRGALGVAVRGVLKGPSRWGSMSAV